MIEFKPGNGGHGPEAYDPETGQYVEVECSIEGQTFKGWEELRDLILNSDPNIKVQYDSNSAQRDAIEEYIKNELYGPLLEEAINRKNAESTGQIFFNDPIDAALNGHKIFTPSFFQMYKDKVSGQKVLVNPDNNYVVNGFACCLQNLRYPKKKMIPISKAEYNSLMSGVSGTVDSGDFPHQSLRRYVAANPNGFPVWRGVTAGGTNIQKVKESFWDENSPYISTLAHARGKNCSYYGAVTYMSMSKDYAEGYAGRALINGFVKNPKSLKILECPLEYYDSNEISCNKAIREITQFRSRSAEFLNNVKKQAETYSNMSPQELNNFMLNLRDDIENNPGLCGIIMGYDAIMGSSNQFDILNPGIVSVLED